YHTCAHRPRAHALRCEPATGRYFFFQAEDGIRDGHVTGVQTCALPISSTSWDTKGRGARNHHCIPLSFCTASTRPAAWALALPRSEERRVGKSVDLGGGRSIKKKNHPK